MDISDYASYSEVKDGEYPFYTKDSRLTPKTVISKIPQGMGSSLDSDTVAGIQAVTAIKAAKNKLVATDGTGKLPLSIMPSVLRGPAGATGSTGLPGPAGPQGASGPPGIGILVDTLANLQATAGNAAFIAIATDIRSVVMYLGSTSQGSGGFIVLGGY